MTSFSRRTFLKSSLYGATAGLLLRPPAAASQSGGSFDLEHDVLPQEALPPALRQRAAVTERTGPLTEGYYAVHVWLLGARFGGRAQQREDEPDAPPAPDEERFARLANAINVWFAQQLSDHRLRFIYHGPLPMGKGPLPDSLTRSTTATLLQSVGRTPTFGGSQQVQVLLMPDGPDLAGVVANTVLLGGWPGADAEDVPALAGPLAHLIGHALGLEHPRPDVDTAGTGWASELSFMHPSVATRGLADSLILDSPLNPQKARLVRSGFFPYQGVIHLARDGAIPLQPGMNLAGEGQEIRIAHGNYVLPAEPGAAAVTVQGANLTVDLGGALVRGDDAAFAEFGEHKTHGTGVRLETTGEGGVTLRGGIISGYHYGIRGDQLRRGRIEGVTLVDNRRLQSDARCASGDKLRGVWLDFWLTPEEDATEFWVGSVKDDNLMAGMGAGVALLGCRETLCVHVLAAHNTIGIADYYGQSNRYEDSDLGGCPMGLRFWQARGSGSDPITIARNRFHFNTQPDPWWWSHGDSAAIIAAGVEGCVIEDNEIVFAGDGLFLSGFPRFPAASQHLVIRGNRIAHCYAHGVELDFGQDCILENNTIAHNWLSGVWAGHCAGILVRGNTFTGNNCGRMYAGWTDTQGALSCAQGRVVAHQNTFEDNWVAVNLWQNYYPAWWLFAGDATGHAVTGNTFRNNRVAVRLKGVTASEVTGNLMQGNHEDLAGDLAANAITDNGPATDPAQREAWFFPVQALLFDSTRSETGFTILWLKGDDAFVVPPDEIAIRPGAFDSWLAGVTESDGSVHFLAQTAAQGLQSAQVEIAARGQRWRVPAKAMGGDFQVTAGRGDPAASDGDDLGTMPGGPAAILGLFPAISDVLHSTRPTTIKGSQAFWGRFTQPDFEVAEGPKVFAVIYTDGATTLTLGEQGPSFAPPPPGKDEGWQWQVGLLELAGSPRGCRLDYVHGARLVEDGVPSCIALWLYPLNEDDLARLPAEPGVAAPPSPDYLLSLPGGRRKWPRPD